MTTQENRETLLGALLERGLLGDDAIWRARAISAEADESIPATLTRLGLVSEEDLAETLKLTFGLSRVASHEFPEGDIPLPRANIAYLRATRILPLNDETHPQIALAMADPTDDEAAKAIELFSARPVVRKVALPTDLDVAFDRIASERRTTSEALETRGSYDESSSALSFNSSAIDKLREAASDAPVIRLVNAMLTRAVDERVSDIHVEPTDQGLAIRFRVDGRLRSFSQAPPLRMRDAIVSRIKLMAGLDIAERRLPQDGRIGYAVRGKEVDFRVATTPTSYGESVVIRVLDRAQMRLDFKELGFDDITERELTQAIRQPHGLLLVTGPTGSGKTTTLYAALSALNTPDRKLMTIEDPIEYQLAGVQQVQVQPGIGLTFARALRSFLRHNPNVVMVGEIRDVETAQVAIQVALTGHLVLSTLHTNDAASGITRLIDMGVEDYLIGSTCHAILAQRLVRTLCLSCKLPFEPTDVQLHQLSASRDKAKRLYRSVGCDACGNTGFSGRTTIIEIMSISDPIRELILRHASSDEIAKLAVGEGMRTLYQHGISKVIAGMTTVEEVMAAVRAV